MNDDRVLRLRKEMGDLLAGLRKELEGKTRNSPEAWKLLRDASAEVGQLRATLAQASTAIERLAAELARRKPPDDDGVPEMVPAGPPKRPRGGVPAFETRIDDDGEFTSSVQGRVHTVPETDKAISSGR